MQTNLKINDQDHTVDVDTRTTLLDVLRNTIDPIDTKTDCGHGHS